MAPHPNDENEEEPLPEFGGWRVLLKDYLWSFVFFVIGSIPVVYTCIVVFSMGADSYNICSEKKSELSAKTWALNQKVVLDHDLPIAEHPERPPSSTIPQGEQVLVKECGVFDGDAWISVASTTRQGEAWCRGPAAETSACKVCLRLLGR